jgi:hypothetical protein
MTARINWQQMSLVRRTDKVNTRRMLLIADARERLGWQYSDDQVVELFDVPSQGNVTPYDRLREAVTVHAYWPEHLLMAAVEFDAPWHALTEAPRWDDVDKATVVAFVEDYLRRRQRWPDVGDIRRVGGRAPNPPRAGESPDQTSLVA